MRLLESHGRVGRVKEAIDESPPLVAKGNLQASAGESRRQQQQQPQWQRQKAVVVGVAVAVAVAVAGWE